MQHVRQPGLLARLATALLSRGHERVPAQAPAGEPPPSRTTLDQTPTDNRGDAARMLVGQRQTASPPAGVSAAPAEREPDAATARPLSALSMSKERLWKEDGRYLITYRFLRPEKENDAPSMDGGKNEVVHCESASLGSDAL